MKNFLFLIASLFFVGCSSESTKEEPLVSVKKIPEIKNKNIDSTNEINLDTIAEDLKNIQNS